MSALPIVANGIPASASSQPSSAGADPAAATVSFGAVLEAQIGTTSSGNQAGLIMREGDAVAAELAVEKEAATNGLTAADIAGGLPFLPINLMPAQAPTTPSAKHVDLTASSASQSIAGVLNATAQATDTESPFAGLAAGNLTLSSSLDADAASVTAASVAASNRQSLPFAEELVRGKEGQAGDLPIEAAPAQLPRDVRVDTQQQARELAGTVPGVVGEGRWGESFSQRVTWMVGQQVQAAQFRVEPPHLGPIEIRLSISNDQANLMFSAPHAVARDAIQTSLPRLQEMLAQTGLTLGNVSVGAHSAQDQRSFGEGANSSSDRSNPAASASISGVVTESQVPLRRGWGMVDLFA